MHAKQRSYSFKKKFFFEAVLNEMLVFFGIPYIYHKLDKLDILFELVTVFWILLHSFDFLVKLNITWDLEPI